MTRTPSKHGEMIRQFLDAAKLGDFIDLANVKPNVVRAMLSRAKRNRTPDGLDFVTRQMGGDRIIITCVRFTDVMHIQH